MSKYLIVKTVDEVIHEFNWDDVDFSYNDSGILRVYNKESKDVLLWTAIPNILYIKQEEY